MHLLSAISINRNNIRCNVNNLFDTLLNWFGTWRLKMNKKKIAQEWSKKHGGASFDFKTRNILLYDGGFFSIQKKKIKLHKIVGYKKLKGGGSQIIFSKKKKIKAEEFTAYLWFEELDDFIKSLQSIRRMLHNLRYRTDRPFKKSFIKKLEKLIKEDKTLR